MANGRDWLKTLHPASFKSVPFQTERDEEEGGRRIVSHEFPNRDDPFNEDLGEAKREYDVTAYLASDTADAQADALSRVCSARGAGVLVLAMQGSITVRCLHFRRSRDKDRAGFVAYTMKFVREGAVSGLFSIASLANLVFAAADAIAPALSGFIAAAVSAIGQPDFVIAAATDALADGAAILETIRTTEAVDPAVSATQRVAIQLLFDAAPAAADSDQGAIGDTFAQLVPIARALADGMDAKPAIAAFEQVIVQTTIAPAAGAYISNGAKLAEANRIVVYLAIQVVAAAAYCEAIARADVPDRPTGITLRANVAEYFEATLEALSAYDGAVYVPVVNLRDATIDYLSRVILDRAPVIDVGANMRLPSLWWAHRLYNDPTRSAELVGRNSVSHPSFMPTEFEALSR